MDRLKMQVVCARACDGRQRFLALWLCAIEPGDEPLYLRRNLFRGRAAKCTLKGCLLYLRERANSEEVLCYKLYQDAHTSWISHLAVLAELRPLPS